MSEVIKFQHTFIDKDAGFDGWGAVAAADFDGDGRPEFATGGKGGGVYYLYDFDPVANSWSRHTLSHAFSPNVGAAASDLDGDGRPELVCGEWGDRLIWFVAAPERSDFGTAHVVATGLRDPHDVLAADVNGDGRDEIIVREKDGRLLLFLVPADPTAAWQCQVIAERLPGDGTAVAAFSGSGALDIVTNAGWFENKNGGSEWIRHPLIPEDLGWHPETRIAVGDVDNDGRLEVVITESEIGPARLAILRLKDRWGPWDAEIVIAQELDLRALHSLQLGDVDGDGQLEIFTAEMENGKTDGVNSRPRWWCLTRKSDGQWQRHVILDQNLGTHAAILADFDGDGRLDIVGKVWRANAVNGCGGRNHVDFLRNQKLVPRP